MEPASLTFQVNVHDGAQKAHIIVFVESVKPRVRDDLQSSVMFPQRAICNTVCVRYHQPVSHFKHVVPAQSNTSVWWWEVRCKGSKSPADSGYKDVKETLHNISVTLFLLPVSYSTKQWAAVMTQRGEMMAPPQTCLPLQWRLTCQPHLSSSAKVPPTIRRFLLCRTGQSGC